MNESFFWRCSLAFNGSFFNVLNLGPQTMKTCRMRMRGIRGIRGMSELREMGKWEEMIRDMGRER